MPVDLPSIRAPKAIAALFAAAAVLSPCAVQAADIFAAMKTGDVDEVKRSLRIDPNLVNAMDWRGRVPLFDAALAGRNGAAMVRALLDAGADPCWSDGYGEQALNQAAFYSTPEVIDMLLDRRADIEARDRLVGLTPLLCAVSTGKEPNVRALLKRGANIRAADKSGSTVLHLLSNVPDDAGNLMEFLIFSGAEVNALDRFGRSPLRVAAYRSRTGLADRLLAHGASWDIFSAVALGRVEVVKGLLAGDPRLVGARDESYQTPLHVAARLGSIAIAGQLLDRNADIDATDAQSGGSSPLYRAIQSCHPDFVRFLVAHGARLDAPGDDGSGRHSAKELAESLGYLEIAGILSRGDPPPRP